MTREIPHVARVRVLDALDFFEPKTIATLATESGADAATVRKIVNECIERGSLERRGNHYRIHHEAPWGTKNQTPAPAKTHAPRKRVPMEDT